MLPSCTHGEEGANKKNLFAVFLFSFAGRHDFFCAEVSRLQDVYVELFDPLRSIAAIICVNRTL